MSDAEFQKAINAAQRAVRRAAELIGAVNAECVDRYGAGYGDLPDDAGDQIVEAIDYAAGSITVKEIAEIYKKVAER